MASLRFAFGRLLDHLRIFTHWYYENQVGMLLIRRQQQVPALSVSTLYIDFTLILGSKFLRTGATALQGHQSA